MPKHLTEAYCSTGPVMVIYTNQSEYQDSSLHGGRAELLYNCCVCNIFHVVVGLLLWLVALGIAVVTRVSI